MLEKVNSRAKGDLQGQTKARVENGRSGILLSRQSANENRQSVLYIGSVNGPNEPSSGGWSNFLPEAQHVSTSGRSNASPKDVSIKCPKRLL